MAKFTVMLVRESYVEIDADSLEDAKEIVSKKGIDEGKIETGADWWDVRSIYPSDED